MPPVSSSQRQSGAQSHTDESSNTVAPCVGCGQIAALQPIGDGSLRVCVSCFKTAVAFVFTPGVMGRGGEPVSDTTLAVIEQYWNRCGVEGDYDVLAEIIQIGRASCRERV